MAEQRYVRAVFEGPWACFTRPEMKVERVSYPVATPSAARGMLEAILWKPQFRWVVTRIGIMRPIRFGAILRNEVQDKGPSEAEVAKWMRGTKDPKPMWADDREVRTQRNTLALRDVAYVVEAYPLVFEPTGSDHPTKYVSMFNRRVQRGQCFHRPYLGCREFTADFRQWRDDDTTIAASEDLGLMLYDIVFGEARREPVFFHATMEDGWVKCDPERVLATEVREEVLACSYAR